MRKVNMRPTAKETPDGLFLPVIMTDEADVTINAWGFSDYELARKRHHDELFARCLWRVIEFHFGSVDRYQGFEYKGVGQLIATLDALKNLKTSS